MFKLTSGLFLIAAACAPARADITAVYTMKDFPVSMTYEVSDEGHARYQMSEGKDYSIFRDGTSYLIIADPQRPLVVRLTDLLHAQSKASASQRTETKGDPQVLPKLVANGKATINGREGVAYTSAKRRTGSVPVLVISADPELAALGQAFKKLSVESYALFERMTGTPVREYQLAQLMDKGAPLRFVGWELSKVSYAKLDSRRFELPGPPMTAEEFGAGLRKKAEGGAPNATPRPAPDR